jgi:signal transduction histidine kinase
MACVAGWWLPHPSREVILVVTAEPVGHHGLTPSRCEVIAGRLTARAVLSRTMVWGALVLCTIGVYIGVVAGLGGQLTSDPLSSPWLAITATVVVAIAFEPLRRRLERTAGRLAYGRRGSPYDVLASVTRQAATLDAGLLNHVARSLAEATGAREAAVWVRTDGQLVRAAVWPTSEERPPSIAATEIDRVPGMDLARRVVHDGELMGLLSLRAGPHGETLPSDERLLEQLASALGLALRNVQLGDRVAWQVDQLHWSRRSIVELQDRTRQRLERDLHDGIQQRLVAMRVKLGLAKVRAGTAHGTLVSRIERLVADTDRAIDAVREFARGIYPPLLEARGLEAAIAAHVRRQPIPVIVKASHVGRHSQSVEAAVYFFVLEALQEAVTRARAGSALVTLRAEDDSLSFDVSDDGTVPIDSDGLQAAMVDRLDALDARVEASISADGRRHLHGTIPSRRVEP